MRPWTQTTTLLGLAKDPNHLGPDTNGPHPLGPEHKPNGLGSGHRPNPQPHLGLNMTDPNPNSFGSEHGPNLSPNPLGSGLEPNPQTTWFRQRTQPATLLGPVTYPTPLGTHPTQPPNPMPNPNPNPIGTNTNLTLNPLGPHPAQTPTPLGLYADPTLNPPWVRTPKDPYTNHLGAGHGPHPQPLWVQAPNPLGLDSLTQTLTTLSPVTDPTPLDPDADPTPNPLGSPPDPTPNRLRSDHGPNLQPSTLNYNKNNNIFIFIIILNIHIKIVLFVL